AAEAFRYLVTPTRTKISYAASDLAQFTRLPAKRFTDVLQGLAQGRSRLLRAVQPATRPHDEPEEVRYEVFHDVLARPIEDWQKLHSVNRARTRKMRRLGAGALVVLALIAA